MELYALRKLMEFDDGRSKSRTANPIVHAARGVRRCVRAESLWCSLTGLYVRRQRIVFSQQGPRPYQDIIVGHGLMLDRETYDSILCLVVHYSM